MEDSADEYLKSSGKKSSPEGDVIYVAESTTATFSPRRQSPAHQSVKFPASPLRSFPSTTVAPLQPSNPSNKQSDDHGFHLFATSFDLLSESDQYSLSDHAISPADNRGNKKGDPSAFVLSHGMDLTLPELKPSPTDNTDSYSLSDISPIKLVFHNSNSEHTRKLDQARRLEEAYLDDHPRSSSSAAHEWKTPESVYFPETSSNVSNPFYVLRSVRQAFSGCKYLLSCVGNPEVCPVHLTSPTHLHHYHEGHSSGSYSVDIKIAERRVETAICAFGGNLIPRRQRNDNSSSVSSSSIFRLKGDTLKRKLYEDNMPNRYYLSGSIISWEVEEDPPISIPEESRDDTDERQRDGTKGRVENRSSDPRRGLEVTQCSFGSSSPTSEIESQTATSSQNARDERLKMKYRCKLCGQWKQNHECSYRQSLQRSIGVMVYPAINSYTAAEPGIVALALTEMNNFVSYESHHDGTNLQEPAYSSCTTVQQAGGFPARHPSTITPASIQTSAVGSFNSPQSSLSHDHSDEGTTMTAAPNGGYGRPSWSAHDYHRNKRPSVTELDRPYQNRMRHPPPPHHHQQVSSPFVPSVVLRPEHYRAVTPSSSSSFSSSYVYPVIPLTFPERKLLSDSLFYLSKDLPGITNECASLLRQARTNHHSSISQQHHEEWDLAVAELLTQVVVGLYCAEGDLCLDGLQKYLIGLGISC